MNRPRGKRMTLLIASAALAVIAGAAFASKDLILTTWYAQGLRSQNDGEQLWAVVSLRQLPSKRAARVLAAYVGDENSEYRHGASQALMEMGELALDPLVEVFPLVDDFDGGPKQLPGDYVGVAELLFALLETQRAQPGVRSLLENIGSRRDASPDIAPPGKYKLLAWKSGVQTIEGTPCRIFLFVPPRQHRTGAQTILITDVGGRVITWKEVGGEPMFISCELEIKNGDVYLVVTCDERHSETPGKYTYRLGLLGIE